MHMPKVTMHTADTLLSLIMLTGGRRMWNDPGARQKSMGSTPYAALEIEHKLTQCGFEV